MSDDQFTSKGDRRTDGRLSADVSHNIPDWVMGTDYIEGDLVFDNTNDRLCWCYEDDPNSQDEPHSSNGAQHWDCFAVAGVGEGPKFFRNVDENGVDLEPAIGTIGLPNGRINFQEGEGIVFQVSSSDFTGGEPDFLRAFVNRQAETVSIRRPDFGPLWPETFVIDYGASGTTYNGETASGTGSNWIDLICETDTHTGIPVGTQNIIFTNSTPGGMSAIGNTYQYKRVDLCREFDEGDWVSVTVTISDENGTPGTVNGLPSPQTVVAPSNASICSILAFPDSNAGNSATVIFETYA